MAAPALPRRPLAAVAGLAVVATLGCQGERPPSDHDARLAWAAASGLPADLRPDWGPAGPRGIACAAHMRDARDSSVRLALATEQVYSDSTRRGDTTVVQRWTEGEYVVSPAGRYGGRATLRVDCSRGASIAPPGA